MKTSVTSYSFGEYFSEEKLGYLGMIDKAKEMGFDGVEYTEGAYMGFPDAAEKIKDRAGECGLEVAAFAVGANFLQPDKEKMKDEIARVCSMVDFAAKAGATKLRHDAAWGSISIDGRVMGYAEAIKIMADAIREVSKYAEQKGVRTMTENHGFFMQDADRVEMLINTVNYPNYGALVDIGNFMCADEDPTLSVSKLAPYAFHVHAKDFHFKSGQEIAPGAGWFQSRGGNYLRGAVIGHGNGKAYQSIQTLKRGGYDGYVTVEFEGIEDKLFGIQLGLENLKRFIEA